MTVVTANITQPMNSGANAAALKAWGAAVSALFSGAGLVATSDTGQVNWTTVTPTYNVTNSTDALVGYEIWKFNDSLQATKPIVLRVEYRDGFFSSGSVNYAYLNIAIGTTTDGAGNLTGTFTGQNVRLSPSGTTSPYSASQLHWSSGDGSYFNLAVAPQATGAVAANLGVGTFWIDRTRDASGAITNEGACWGGCGYQNNSLPAPVTGGAAGTGFFETFSFGGSPGFALLGSATVASAGVTLPAYVPGSGSNGTQIAFDAPAVVANQKVLPPVLGALAYWNADIAAGSTVTVPVSGSNHTYYCLGSFAACADRLPGQTTAALALRYE